MFSKVQKHLLKAGGLPADVKPSLALTLPPLGSLDTQQVASLEMLAKVYIHAEGNDCLEAAAAIFNALATRVNGYGTASGVSLDKRLELFQLAVMQVGADILAADAGSSIAVLGTTSVLGTPLASAQCQLYS